MTYSIETRWQGFLLIGGCIALGYAVGATSVTAAFIGAVSLGIVIATARRESSKDAA